MNNHNDQKDWFEESALDRFTKEYNRNNSPPIIKREKLAPPQPDYVCTIDGRELGVEVTHLYGSEAEAKVFNSPGELVLHRHESDSMSTLSLRDRFVPELNRLLEKKAVAHYSFDGDIWLLIRIVEAAWWSRALFEKYKNGVRLPESHPFSQIWFLFDDSETFEIVNVYPGSPQAGNDGAAA